MCPHMSFAALFLSCPYPPHSASAPLLLPTTRAAGQRLHLGRPVLSLYPPTLLLPQVNAYIWAGQWWRLFTSALLHSSVWHLVVRVWGGIAALYLGALIGEGM